MPARYRHFKTPGEIQPGADQSTTPEGGKGVKHVRCGGFEGDGLKGRRWNGVGREWTSLENEDNGRSDELRRNSQAVGRCAERREGDVQNPRMIPGADRVSEYD